MFVKTNHSEQKNQILQDKTADIILINSLGIIKVYNKSFRLEHGVVYPYSDTMTLSILSDIDFFIIFFYSDYHLNSDF